MPGSLSAFLLLHNSIEIYTRRRGVECADSNAKKSPAPSPQWRPPGGRGFYDRNFFPKGPRRKRIFAGASLASATVWFSHYVLLYRTFWLGPLIALPAHYPR